MSKTSIKKCNCQHKAQDEMYGKGMRVHNSMRTDKQNKWRCTVCGNEKP